VYQGSKGSHIILLDSFVFYVYTNVSSYVSVVVKGPFLRVNSSYKFSK